MDKRRGKGPTFITQRRYSESNESEKVKKNPQLNRISFAGFSESSRNVRNRTHYMSKETANLDTKITLELSLKYLVQWQPTAKSATI